jgi:hypothetical protein
VSVVIEITNPQLGFLVEPFGDRGGGAAARTSRDARPVPGVATGTVPV